MLWFLPDAKGSCPVSELQIYFCFFFSYSFLILFSLRNYMYVLANSTYFTLTKVIYVWLIQILHPHLMPSCQIHVLVTDVIHVQYNLHCMATPPVSHVEFKFLDYTPHAIFMSNLTFMTMPFMSKICFPYVSHVILTTPRPPMLLIPIPIPIIVGRRSELRPTLSAKKMVPPLPYQKILL
jgi:hypothetical protein